MKLPASMVRLRSALAHGLGLLLRFTRPARSRIMRFVWESCARGQIRGLVEPGAQFFGLVTVEGTGNISIGAGTRVGRRAFLETQGSGCIVIGRNVVINDGAVIVAYDRVEIGDFTMIGEYVTVRDANHGIDTGVPMRRQPHTSAPVRIGTDAWLGRGVCVLKGVSVGDGAVIGANSVVTKDIEAMAIAVGAPARTIGRRDRKRMTAESASHAGE